MNVNEFSDQLVHLKFLSIPVYKNPVKIASVSFKHRREISDFSITNDDIGFAGTINRAAPMSSVINDNLSNKNSFIDPNEHYLHGGPFSQNQTPRSA